MKTEKENKQEEITKKMKEEKEEFKSKIPSFPQPVCSSQR